MDTDCEHANVSKRERSVLGFPSSWQGIQVCATVASVAPGLNVVLAAVAFGFGYANTKGASFVTVPLYEGSCSTTKNWSVGMHLVINGIGTFILSTSNYCAQFLAAPSREDLDRAHAKGSWLDIGVPSLRNILALERRKKCLWALLMLSTIPVHAFYNSVLLSAQSSNEYGVFVLPEDYDGSQSLNLTGSSTDCFEKYTHQSLADFESDIKEGKFQKLTPQQCLDTFAVDYLYGHGSLAILSSSLTWDLSPSMKFVGHANTPSAYEDNLSQDPYSWMCRWHGIATSASGCRSSDIQSQMPDWKIIASNWQEPQWDFTVPWANGSMTYSQDNYTICERGRFCSNMHRLASFVWPDPSLSTQDLVPLTSQDLKNYTNSPSYWGGSFWSSTPYGDQTSWAENVTWQQTGAQCTRYRDLNYAYYTSDATIDKDFKFASLGLYAVDGCLSTTSEEHCQLLFNPIFSIVVILCSATKVACILYVSQRERARRILTVGDAIASFLSRPDPFTVGRCTSSSSDWIKPSRSLLGRSVHSYHGISQQRLDCRKRRWYQAVAPKQWVLTLGLAIIILSFAGFLLHRGLQDRRLIEISGVSWHALWKLGLGSASPYTLIYRIQSTFLGNVLLANTPQIILSLSYYFYNSTLTAMMMAAEYDHYAIRGMRHDASTETIRVQKRKGLRVSTNRRGAQRSYYFLSLPYRYSIPLLLSYTILHWLVSQALFYVRVNLYDGEMQHHSKLDVNACGWSPIALIAAIIVGSLMVISLLILSARSFRSVIPLAGSCSAAISAACHPADDDVDAAIKHVMWGEVTLPDQQSLPKSYLSPLLGAGQGDGVDSVEMQGKDNEQQKVSRCTFSSFDVDSPTLLQTYG